MRLLLQTAPQRPIQRRVGGLLASVLAHTTCLLLLLLASDGPSSSTSPPAAAETPTVTTVEPVGPARPSTEETAQPLWMPEREDLELAGLKFDLVLSHDSDVAIG